MSIPSKQLIVGNAMAFFHASFFHKVKKKKKKLHHRLDLIPTTDTTCLLLIHIHIFIPRKQPAS